MLVTGDKDRNLEKASTLVVESANNGANVVILPECFNSPYDTKCFPQYAETIPGETTDLLSKLALDNNIYIIGGSIPERENGKFYNTCPVFDPFGKMIAKHRKMHLVDISVPGRLRFREAESLSPGNSFTVFDTSFCRFGIGVCYDLRFGELADIYREMGCKFIVYPGAFNMVTGPAHMEPLLRARAIDNEVYTALVSAARDESASYIAWGHSTVVNPWGEVVSSSGFDETIVYADVDPDYVDTVRKNLPIMSQKRTDLYVCGSRRIDELT